MFLDLDDAMNVLIRHGFLDKGYVNTDGLDLVRGELEQKCYIKSEDDNINRICSIACDINPVEIASQIERDNLGQWCKIIRADLTACVAKAEQWGEEE